MTRLGFISMSLLVVAACDDGIGDGSDPAPNPGTGAAGGVDNTFDHPNADQIDPFALANRLAEEGPPRYTSHVHSCAKVPITTLGHMLAGWGVNLAATGATSAGKLYTGGNSALGEASFPNRIRESIQLSTSGMSREFDIFAAAAPEVVTAMPTATRCSATMFTGDTCNLEGISCLLGVTATATHKSLCDLTITSSSNVTVGKNLAVAVIMAAGNTCL
jgi:hypothetical protein